VKNVDFRMHGATIKKKKLLDTFRVASYREESESKLKPADAKLIKVK
jgi:hypothetical protein